ncbi:TPR repeat protein [Pseudomonas frederiksbergensis]|uniref:tetratricopeptide repeat protein n=1 Tax=Pseudomonas frederiksbergensis TaxID=104087 RepID=UPI003D1F46F5
MKRKLACALLFMSFVDNACAEITSEQELAKTKGIILYNQYKAASATSLLTVAAEAGDPEAQYFLAESLRSKNHFLNPEARHWYEAAAAQNDLYAMIQLGRSKNDICDLKNDCPANEKKAAEWLNQARDLAKPKADLGDAEAMYIMYKLTLDDSWLEKSASAGHPIAQYWLAVGYKQGDGVFLPWKRSEAVEKWFKASAEGGYPKSMMEYATILFEKGDIEGFRYWNEQAALAGYAETVYGYGSYLAHEPDRYGFPLDLVKGYAYVYSLSELDGGGDMQTNVEYKLPIIAAKMTPAQILEAKGLAKAWKVSHPPVSFFPDKLSQ